MVRHLCEAVKPTRMFIVLKGKHHLLKARYEELGFTQRSVPSDKVIMAVEGDAEIRQLYLLHRSATKLPDIAEIEFPSLIRFLAAHDRLDIVAGDQLTKENHYTEPLPPTVEVPRLSAQNRMLIEEQRSRLAATPFPPPPASLLDVGSGDGRYLATMLDVPSFRGYAARGVEPDPIRRKTAQSERPHLVINEGSAYALGEDDLSQDVVTASFVFIHLGNPDLALLEMNRVLRNGGLLYVVDVNDNTFSGPEIIGRLIDTHDKNYDGDRQIMDELPRRATEFGFELIGSHSTTMLNTGKYYPEYQQDKILLAAMDAWKLLSFIRPQTVVKELFQEAQDYYFSSQPEFSMNLETRVFKKTANVLG